MLVAARAAHGQGLDDFSRLSRAIGKEVSIVDQSGLVREGVVEMVAADEVRLRFGSATQWLPIGVIASVDQLKDGRRDGAIKGAVFGAITGALTMYSFHRHPEWLSPNANRSGMSLLHVTTWSGIGWLVDAVNTSRKPLYRGPVAASMGTLKLSFGF